MWYFKPWFHYVYNGNSYNKNDDTCKTSQQCQLYITAKSVQVSNYCKYMFI